MFYFASPEETPGRMTDLVDWYRAEEAAPTMHPVALAAEFHYRFVRIHPFDDGNGRMSRLLMNLILMRHGYPMTVIQAADRNGYLAALAEADSSEPEPFLHFIIENVESSLRLMIRAARGESIDEPSDLDKKLALLKKQVLTRQDAIATLWNEEYQAEFYKILFKFWQDDLTQQIQLFRELFINIESAFGAYATGIEDVVHDIDAEAAFQAPILMKTSYLWFALEEFRIAKNSFSQVVRLSFSFHNTEFTASFHTGPIPFSGEKEEFIFSPLYKKEYDHAQIHEINYQLANKVYDFIASKLAEVDTPPA
jgi:hypothetical protein